MHMVSESPFNLPEQLTLAWLDVLVIADIALSGL